MSDDDLTQVTAANDYPIELWRDEAARETTWAQLRYACGTTATQAGRKLATDREHPEQRHHEYAREVLLEGDGYMLLPSDEDEADAVRLRLTCWTTPA